jgi:hypothetical protein
LTNVFVVYPDPDLILYNAHVSDREPPESASGDLVGNHGPLESADGDFVGALQHIEFGQSGYNRRGSETPSDFVIVHRIAFNDFSALRILKLHSTSNFQTLPPPENFPSLITLALTRIRDPATSSYWTAALILMRNLPCLTSVQLNMWNRFVSVVPGLSPNLRKLQLSTLYVPGNDPLSCDYIQQLASMCPHLEELAIEMTRSRGDATEVALVPSLGAASPVATTDAHPRRLSHAAGPDHQKRRDRHPGHVHRAVV